MKENLFIKNLPPDFNFPAETVGEKLLREYGAVFLARGGAVAPGTVIFTDEKMVAAFQSGVTSAKEKIGDYTIELQRPAMIALRRAIRQTARENLTISPRNQDAAKRSYAATVENWTSRVEPGLEYWVEKGRLTPSEASRIKALAPVEQITEIFDLESKGMFFAKTKDKSIIYSVAPPGASQHLSMLALDIAEFDQPAVREIMARWGWFQTVPTDLPHFTYLGVPEGELPGLGLKRVIEDQRVFWVPDL